jgi:NitT/TauT family transport system substrate-binding protein
VWARCLLHILTLALLRKKGIDATQVKFVVVGSNAQVLEAVSAGKVDAGLSGVAGASGPSNPRVLENGRLWLELPEYTYELSYASVQALQDKPDALARCMAAYTRTYRYLSTPQSEAAYLQARRHAGDEHSSADGEAVWNFIQRNQPYALEPGLSPERVAYLQQLNVTLGVQSRALPFDQVVDLAPSQGARKLLAKTPR